MSGRGTTLSPLFLTVLGLAAANSCSGPTDPPIQPERPKNAQRKVERIRREEARAAAEVGSGTQSAGGSGTGGAGVVGSTPALPPETPSGTLTGRLEAAGQDRIVIRDEEGVEHWFEPDPNTRVSRNGEPVQLSDLPRGTEVRATYARAGQSQRLIEVQVLSAS